MKQVKFKFPVRMMLLVLGLVLSASAFAQSTVSGLVKDETGEPVIGATIRVDGTSDGAITDIDGNFTLNAKPGAKLTISYVGYTTQQASASSHMVITLQPDTKNLNEVVVIGYGVAKKNDLTGSVVAIKPDEKNHGIVTTAQDMLQGKIAGVNVNSTSGAPGEGAQVRIRGGASLNANNDPLYVIDGMQMNSDGKGTCNALALINPNDIETFTVLKDASATAIYGSRGSNGVIIITTKKGRKNQAPKVSYNGTMSISTVAKKLDVMDANEYVSAIEKQYGKESAAYKGLGWKQYDADGNPVESAGTYNTDWQDAIYRTAFSHDHNISVAGGVGNSKWSMPYRVSVGYTGQQGILSGSDFKRFTAGFTANPTLLDEHLNINLNGKYTFSRTCRGGEGAIGSAISMDPTRPITSTDSKYDAWGGYWQWVTETSSFDPTFPYQRNSKAPSNPVEQVDNFNYHLSAHTLLGNVELDYKIHGFEDLHLHANLAGDYTFGGSYTDYDGYNSYAYYYGSKGQDTQKRFNLQATAYAQYVKDFNDNHHFDIMAGYEYSHMKYWGDNWYKSYYPSTYQGTDDSGNALAGTESSSSANYWCGQTYLVSWIGRANYTLLNRYLFTVTARYDGSSRFADGHRWGFFPSAAFAWRIKDEAFLKNNKTISDLKLRLGWGQTGQQDTGKEYYTPTYKMSTNKYYYYPVGAGSLGNSGVLYRPLAYNNDLTWETTTTYNVGIDYGMFNQRLTLNADAYYRKTKDLLSTTTIPTGQNFDNSLLMNAGTLENKGVELAISGKPIVTNNWFVELGVNAAYNKNKITALNDGRDMMEAGMTVGTDQCATYHKVGKPASSFWVYQQVYDETGRPIMGCYVDRNGDGVIDENDRYFYKSITAPWTGGFYLKVSYKNWDLGTNWRASFGNYVYNDLEQGKINSAVLFNSGYYENNTPAIVNLGWTSYNYALSDYFVQNASFLKCDNITLGYNFDSLMPACHSNKISGRIYVSCTNVFTITNYKGLDPEQYNGKESSVYPRSRTFLLGLNLNF